MSSRAVKISWYIGIVLGFSLCMAVKQEDIKAYYTGKCINRTGTRHPTASCGKYLQCGRGGTADIKDCKDGKIFNITSKTCVKDATFSCQDKNKLEFYKWLNIDETYSEVKRGAKLPMPATLKGNITYFDKIDPVFNSKSYILLKTRYLAVKEGFHKFHSKCSLWCKIWIRREECDTRELVLHQKEYKGGLRDKVEYNVQKGFNMSFGTFYYFEAVHFGDGRKFELKLGVEWPGQKKIDEIPAVLLRSHGNKKCPKQPPINVLPTNTTSRVVRPSLAGTLSLTGSLTLTGSSTHTVRPTTSRIPAPTAKLEGLTSSLSSHSIRSLPYSVSQTTVLNIPTNQSSTAGVSTALPGEIRPSPSATSPPGVTTSSWSTQANPSAGPKTPSPKSELQDLADKLEDFLSLDNQTNHSLPQQNSQDGGLSQARQVDLKGEKIAEKWSKRGKSLTFYYKNVVMEVHFPLSNYTFPSRNVTAKIGNEFQSDQIFIPTQALVSKSGDFKRKVFSALYLNLNEKIPRSFNVVETETNEIRGSYQLNSHIIASTAVPSLSGLQGYDIVIRLAHLKTNFSSDVKPMCAFFKWNNEINSDGVWSTEGCIRDEKLSSGSISVCRCNHLTHFAILMQIDEQKLSSTHLKALRFITYIGCALSLIGVCLTVLAIGCLRGARSERNFIHVNLAVAIGLAQVTFLAGIDETGIEVVCTIVAALLHYFLLVAFFWMLIEGIFLHILIVKVFHDHLPKKRFYVTFCWGLPLIIVLLAVNLLRDGYGTNTSCWLSTDKYTIWTFSGPAILVMIINIIILCKVMKEISSLRSSDRSDSNVRSIRYGVRSTIILLPLLGLTWAFGLICVNEDLITFQYLFTIFNSLQGLFIFLFHCVFNTEVRKAFWRKVDLWFTTHNNPFGNNGHSRSSFKRSKDDHSSTCSPEKEKKMPERNGFSMYSFSDLTERERRKLSTATASTCIDQWPQKPSLTPSMDNGPYPKRFSPTMTADDIKYRPIYKQGDAGQRRITPNILQIGIKVEDLNGNTESLDRDCAVQSLLKEANSKQQNGPELEIPAINEASYIQKQPQQNYGKKCNENETLSSRIQQKPRFTKHGSRESFADEVTVGIGGQAMNSGESKGYVRKIEVNNTPGKVSNITDRKTSEDTSGNSGTKL